MRKRMITLFVVGAMGFAAPAARAQDESSTQTPAEPAAETRVAPAAPKPKSLFELLDMVKHGLEVEKEENLRREQEFGQAREDQERLLAEGQLRQDALKRIDDLVGLIEKLDPSHAPGER